MVNRIVNQLKTSVAGVALVSGMVFSTAAFADEVTLISADGTSNIVGEFVDFKDDAYVIRTTLGDLRVRASNVRCEGDACPTFDVQADVVIAGSDAIGLGMMPLLMTGFATSLDADAELTNSGAGETIAKMISEGGFGDEIGSYLVSATNDNAAFDALLDGSASVGMSSRRIKKTEARALRAAGAGSMVSPSQERIIAVDSMVVVAHASNDVSELTMDQLRGIFSGKIVNWSELGGEDRDINVVVREEDSASFEFFMDYLFEGDLPDFLPQSIARDDQELSNVIYHDKNAIGYLGYAFQRGAKPITLINECGIAVKPDAFSAKTEEYDLNRRMYLYSRSDNMDAQSAAFLDFAISKEADGVISKSGFIDLGITRRNQDLGEDRAVALSSQTAGYGAGFEGEVKQEMLDQMVSYDRLSTTFRFRTGSSKVDERGKLDMLRLVDYLKSAPGGTEVTFVGFTDDVGAFEANRKLSAGRADVLASMIKDVAGQGLDHIVMKTAGYGEIAPSACNVSERGRAVNRRVEVWISKEATS